MFLHSTTFYLVGSAGKIDQFAMRRDEAVGFIESLVLAKWVHKRL